MNSPENTLFDFFEKMHQWEVESLKLVDDKGIINVRDEIREKLVEIYDEFLLKPGGKNGRLRGPSVRFPPEYNKDLEEVLHVDKSNQRKVIIKTLWQDPVLKNFNQEQKYTISLVKDLWKISKKEIYSSVDDKWENRVF